MRTIRLAILFSGNGSNLENIYTKMQGMEINSSLGAPFALSENFGEQQTPSLVLSPKFSLNTKLPPQILELDSNKSDSSESNESSLRGRIADSHEAIHESIKLDFIFAISSKESAFGITRCANLGLKCEIVDYKQNKADFIPQIIALLKKNQIDLVILAGFMRILPPEFTAKFRAINIHPSILPLFKGAHAIKESFESDMKIAGVSVHFVSDELDSGVLIAQDIIHKIEGESLESFEARIHNLEYEIYPKAIIKAIKMITKDSL